MKFCVLTFLFIFILRVNSSSLEEDKIVSLPDQPSVDFKQYSGYMSVSESRKLFYYFVEAEVHPASKPVVLWLSGGPGCSSIGGGAFVDNGPFKLTVKGLVRNPYSWNSEANMLYLDSPVGVGFSYSVNTSSFCMNDEFTARDNLVFLQHWFSKFYKFKTNDFFIAGEGYAGHYAPQLAQLILRTKANINLKGIAIENPLLEFNTDFNSIADFLWLRGHLSSSTYEMLKSVCDYATIKRQHRTGEFTTDCLDVNTEFSMELEDCINTFNMMDDICPPPPKNQAYLQQGGEKARVCRRDATIAYLNRKETRKAFHAMLVGIERWSLCSGDLVFNMQNLENPTIYMLGTLVKLGVRVLTYSGSNNAVIPFIGTRTLINEMAKDFGFNTTRPYHTWFQGGLGAGSTQIYENILTFATIKDGGNSAQPERTLAAMKAFLKRISSPTS